jgi:hypothetical protein
VGLFGLADGVGLINAAGELIGAPFVTLGRARLRPGQIAVGLLFFEAPSGLSLDFRVRVFAGTL